MNTSRSLPLAASRLLVKVALILTAITAVFFLLISVILGFAWPDAAVQSFEAGMKVKLADIQPWFGLVLVGASAMLALAARLFHRLSMILRSVAGGDPFTVDNSRRLRHIGWLMILMQIVGFLTGLAGRHLPTEQDIGSGFELSFSGLLAAFLAFVVAQLFEQARAMREDLEGTV